jgi:cysteine desulfurase
MYGGGQQKNLRPGTENISGISGMKTAAGEMLRNIAANHSHAAVLKASVAEIISILPDTYINETGTSTSPYILNISFEGVKAEVLVHMLSKQNIYVSAGAACRKAGNPPLTGMGFSKKRAESAIRFSFSYANTLEETETVKDALEKNVRELRKIRTRRSRANEKNPIN